MFHKSRACLNVLLDEEVLEKLKPRLLLSEELLVLLEDVLECELEEDVKLLMSKKGQNY